MALAIRVPLSCGTGAVRAGVAVRL